MPAAEWKVLPHGGLEQLEENIWTVSGKLAIPFNPLTRVMTIVKRDDGTLLLHGLIALDEARQRAVETLGEIAHLVVPSGFHRLDAARYKARYPKAKLYTPNGARRKVETRTSVDGVYSDFPKDDTTELVSVAGLGEREGALVIRSRAGLTYVLNDALFNMPHENGLSGFVLRHLTQSTGGPKVSRTARIGLVSDRKQFRGALEAIADVPSLRRVIVAHHLPIVEDPPSALRSAAAAL